MARLSLKDIINEFEDIEEDISKLPDTLDTMPVGTDMYEVLSHAAQYYSDKFNKLRDRINEEK